MNVQAFLREARANSQRGVPYRKFKSVAFSALALLLCAPSASALDTDIYFDRAVDELPNVVFYMDTSGSMGGYMSNVPQPYDPLTTYSGDFDADTVYYGPSGRVPSTPSAVSAGARGYIHCDAANTGIDTRGFFSDRLVARLPNSVPGNPTAQNVWLPISRGQWDTTDSHMVDCYADRGVHGENGSAGSDLFLRDSTNSAWTNNTTQEIDWADTNFTTAYLGNYINYKLNPPIYTQTELYTNAVHKAAVMKRVMTNVIHLFPNINAGLARLNSSGQGASVILPVTDNTDPAARQVFEDTLNTLPTAGSTPLTEGLYEIYRYYRGDAMHFSDASLTHAGALNGSGDYASPVTHECQRNHVMMFTDGTPYRDESQQIIATLPNFGAVTGDGACNFGTWNRNANNSCLDELPLYMATQDISPTLPNVYDDDNDGTNEGQTVKVHPVGVQVDFQLLQDVADAAGTNYISAGDALKLENDIVETLTNITGNSSVASRIVTSSDQFSRISHRNEIYTAMYEPTSYFQWKGNLKKYRIAYNGLTPYLTDSDEVNNPDILTAGGSLIASAQSYWTASPDGNNVLDGGVREQLKAKDPATRNFYGVNNETEKDLTDPDHALDLSVTAVAQAMDVAARSAAEQQDILDFALGYDVKDEDADAATISRGHIGAMVRNEPLVIQYGGTEADPDVVVFAATSDGILHGFDGGTGEELFAISPLDSVPNFADQYDNGLTGTSRGWGIDGQLFAVVIDKDLDGSIEPSDGDTAHLFVPYGLGGRVIYAFDVTRAHDSSSPDIELIARLSHTDPNMRWAEMGHVLSKPAFARTTQSGSPHNLLAYGLGYDPNAEFSYTGHTMGRGIAIVRPDDAYSAWVGVSSASTASADKYFNNMDYAFVAEPSPVDTNGDGFTDHFYAADLGAQVWRFDFADEFNTRSGSSVDGHRIATLGSDSNGERRRAFKPIQTALVQDNQSTWVALAFGTGDRMNPLTSDNDNRLYVLKDTNFNLASPTWSTVDNSDLYDATNNDLGTLTDQTQLLNEYEDLANAKGWYIDLPADRKAISTPLISQGIVNFPVYSIPSNSNPCARDLGEGTLYRMALFDAQPVFDYNNNSNLDTSDREVALTTPGIPADLVEHRDESGNLTVCSGLECLPADPTLSPGDETPEVFENYWFQRQD